MSAPAGDRAKTLAASRHPSGTSRVYRLLNSETALAIICLGPACLVLGFILAYPVVSELGLAFFRRNLLHPEQGTTFVGFGNFVWLFTGQSSRFGIAAVHSLLLTVSDVTIELIVGTAAALLLASPFRGVSVVRSLAILPWAIPPIVVAFIFRTILSPQYGLVNQIIRGVLSIVQGHPSSFAFDWFGDSTTAFLATIGVFDWKGFPFVFLVLLAGVQSLPWDLGDAAKVDGATWWQEFRYITLPLLRPVIVIAAILRGISTFNQFDLLWLLTGGGPLDATFVLPIMVYNEAFVVYNAGRAAAVTAFMFVVLATATILLVSLDREEGRQA